MNEEEKRQFEEMQRRLDEVYEFFNGFKLGGSSMIKVIARTSDTVAGGGLVINTPDGPVTLLRV